MGFVAVLMAYYLQVNMAPGRQRMSARSRANPLARPAATRLVQEPVGATALLTLFVIGYIIWSLVPVLIAIQFGFNDGRSRSTWQGFSLRWYYGDPDLSVWNDPSLRESLLQSLKLAGLTMLIATPLGVALALGLARWRGRGAKPANFLMLFPLVTPEIVMGVALFLVFVYCSTSWRWGRRRSSWAT